MTARKNAADNQAAEVEAAMEMGQQTVRKVIRTGQEMIGMFDFEKTVEAAHTQADKMNRALLGGFGKWAAMNQANLEACRESAGVVARGAGTVSREMVELTRNTMKTGVDNGKTLMACRTFNEVIDRQNAILNAGLDSMLAETARLTDMSMNLFGEALQPVQSRATGTLDDVFGTPTA